MAPKKAVGSLFWLYFNLILLATYVSATNHLCPSPRDVCTSLFTITNQCTGVTRNYSGERSQAMSCHVTAGCLNQTIPKLDPELTILQLIVNSLPNDSGVTFSNLTALKTLQIMWQYGPDDILQTDKNELIDRNLFADMRNLQILRISVPLSNMSAELLLDLDSLQELDLSDTGYISTEIFAGLYRGSNLTDKPLDCLILKRISGVDSGEDRRFLLRDLLPLFDNETLLRVLDVSNNRDIYLYPGISQSLPHVHDFRVTGNLIRYLSDPLEAACALAEVATHRQMRRFQVNDIGPIGSDVDLIGTYIPLVGICLYLHPINNTCFCDTFINVCGHLLPEIKCEYFREYSRDEIYDTEPVADGRNCSEGIRYPPPENLEEFNMGGSETYSKFKGWRNLTLCFGKNKLKSLDLSFISWRLIFNSYHIIGWDNVTKLNFSHSGWGFYFHDTTFLQYIPRLEILDFTDTNIGVYISNDTHSQLFSRSYRLRELYLVDAHVTSIPYGEFTNLTRLEVLDLSNNALKHISFVLSDLTSLTALNLSNNEIYQLSSAIIHILEGLSAEGNKSLSIDLSKNQFVCDCQSLDFLSWLKTPTNVKLERGDAYLCTYQGLGKVILEGIDLWKKTLECWQIVIVITVVGFLTAVTVTTTVVCYRYRWKLRTQLLRFAHFRSQQDTDMFTFDGFVVYSDADRHWVHGPLLTRVEEDAGLRLCIHHRDFLPGNPIDEQIVENIDRSRKTLLVMTVDFLRSSWCQYELMTARHKLHAEGQDVVVPLLLTELPPDLLKRHPVVRNLLRERTYLRWDTSIDGQEYFWRKLVLAMRSKRRVCNVEPPSPEEDAETPLTQMTSAPTCPSDPPYHAGHDSDQ